MAEGILKYQKGIHMEMKGSLSSFIQKKKNTMKSTKKKKKGSRARRRRRRVRVRENVSFMVKKAIGRRNALSS